MARFRLDRRRATPVGAGGALRRSPEQVLGVSRLPVPPSALIDYRATTILLAGLLLIGVGLLELLGWGFGFIPAGLGDRLRGGQCAAAVYGTGLVYGLSGFCSGPLLGAVLTVAATSADPAVGAALLLTYSLGVAAPLLLIARLWDRYDLGRKAWLRGRSLQMGALEIHTTNLLAGLLFILLGLSFIVFQGSSALSGTYDDLGLSEFGFRAQLWLSEHLAGLPDATWAGIVLLAAAVVGLRRRRSRAERQPAARHESARFLGGEGE